MIIKDLLVNYSVSSRERFAFLKVMLSQLKDFERVIFVGDTFYINDLNLTFITEFLDLLNEYSDRDIFIQDMDTFRAKMEGVDMKSDSWYKIPAWPKHVKLYILTDDIGLYEDELRKGIVFEQIRERAELDQKILDIKGRIGEPVQSYNQEFYDEHVNDLIGVFMNEVRDKGYEKDKSEKLTTMGINALLRR